MITSYKQSCKNVNNFTCLTSQKINSIVLNMNTLASRLKTARKYAQLSQVELASKLKGLMTQQNISLLENGTTNGTEYIVQLAMCCHVSPTWLATGEGEMTNFETYTRFQTQVLKAMQEMDAETQYKLVQISHTLAEPHKDNGTDQQ